MNWKSFIDYKDIRFWLGLLFIVRLYAITLPPLESQHPWRQTDGLMIARNFYEIDSNIFYPRVSIAGEKTGITGSEFPILNYLIYLVSLVFGYQHWYGRLIVLIFSTLGSLYFYKSIRKFFEENVAFSATIILTASYWFSYSRKIFPDCFSAGLCLMALYFILEYLEGGKISYLLVYFVLGLLGCLSKISSATLLSVLAVPVFFSRFPMNRKVWTCVTSGFILIGIYGWNFMWVPYLNKTFGFGDHFTQGCPLFSTGWAEIKANWLDVLDRLYIVPMKYIGLLLFLISLVYFVYRRLWTVLLIFIIPYFFFLVVILKTGSSIMSDRYYILVAIPAMAFLSGYGLAQLQRKTMMILLIAVAVENIGDQISDFRPHRINAGFQNLESVTDKVSQRTDLFATNMGTHCPTAMYFAHRRGWGVGSSQLLDATFVSDLKNKGCRFVLICKQSYGAPNDVVLNYPQLYESEFFRIYSLP